MDIRLTIVLVVAIIIIFYLIKGLLFRKKPKVFQSAFELEKRNFFWGD